MLIQNLCSFFLIICLIEASYFDRKRREAIFPFNNAQILLCKDKSCYIINSFKLKSEHKCFHKNLEIEFEIEILNGKSGLLNMLVNTTEPKRVQHEDVIIKSLTAYLPPSLPNLSGSYLSILENSQQKLSSCKKIHR